jgi:hypothetical protein
VATLVRYTELAERTVPPCDPGIAAARIKRADRLEAVGAFVVALAARQSRFCYHQLFAVLLRSSGAVPSWLNLPRWAGRYLDALCGC